MTIMIGLTITSTYGAPSTHTDTPGALDYEVTLTDAEGNATQGEVTLCPRQYDGKLAAWGTLDNWCSDALVSVACLLTDHSRAEFFAAIVADCIDDDTEREIEVELSAAKAAESDVTEVANAPDGIQSLRDGARVPPAVEWGEAAANAARATVGAFRPIPEVIGDAWRAAYELTAAKLAEEWVAEHDVKRADG